MKLLTSQEMWLSVTLRAYSAAPLHTLRSSARQRCPHSLLVLWAEL